MKNLSQDDLFFVTEEGNPIGHEDITTTMRYTHLIADNIKRVADLFSISG